MVKKISSLFIVLLSFKIFITKATAETVLFVAIFPFQLNERLGVASRFDRQAHLLPHPDDMVVFGFQLFEEVEGTIAEHLLGTMTPIGKQHGNRRINHQEVERTISKVLLIPRTGGTKGVMGLPIRGDMGRKERSQLFDAVTFHQLAQSCFLLIKEVGQLRDTDVREVLRAQTEKAP